MTYSSRDTDLYMKGVQDFAHLLKTWGATEVVKDLKAFFPDQYNQLEKAVKMDGQQKKLAALLDAPKV